MNLKMEKLSSKRKINKVKNMKTLESFKKSNKAKKRVSKLLNYKDEIMDLYFENYTIEQILEFLKNNKVQISRAALYNYINRNKNVAVTTANTKVETVKIKQKINKPITPAPVTANATKKNTGDDPAMDNFFNSVDDVCDNK